MTCSAIILAAGSSTRMDGTNKQLLELGGIPVLMRSALNFENCGEVSEIIIAARENDREVILSECQKYKITKLKAVCAGGKDRAESAKIAFGFTGKCDYVAVHDGARPFAEPALIGNVIKAAEETGAAIAAIPVTDTVKKAENGFITATPPRSSLFSAQTPQVFKRELYEKMCGVSGAVTDDSSLAEQLGVRVKIAEGCSKNIKITTPADIPVGEIYAGKGEKMFRIGHGYDVHRLVPERRLILGGVEIPCDLGLLGHSDADVLVHAVCDALLGALALGDIGKHFPDTDPKYKDADSMKLLEHVVALIEERGCRLSNLDATISAEKPKLAPHIEQMRENIARVCKASPEQVSVKATTEEGLGLKGEGVGATCVCILEKND